MPADSLDLAVASNVKTFLADGPFASADVTPLSGGYGNYTYRLRLQQPYCGQDTLILKHGKPHLPGATDFAFDLARQKYEQAAMHQVKAMLQQEGGDALVSVPEVHLFDQEAGVMIMDDCGEKSITLKALLQSGAPGVSHATIRKLGDALGTFLARLHAWGSRSGDVLDVFEGNKQARTLSAWVTYGRLVETLDGTAAISHLSDPPLEVAQEAITTIQRIAQETTERVVTSRETLVMGDFWPGDVLLSLVEKGGEVDIERALVVDWELVKPGLRGLDIGQFCAEMFQMRRFYPNTEPLVLELVDEFLGKYRDTFQRASDDEGQLSAVAGVALAHIGAHLVAWTPRGTWQGKETIRAVVLEGVQCLLDGDEGRRETLDKSFVGRLTVEQR